jgi:hypothetical protein
VLPWIAGIGMQRRQRPMFDRKAGKGVICHGTGLLTLAPADRVGSMA